MDDEESVSSFLGGFRSEGFPTQYEENKTPAHVDILEAGIFLAFIILAVTFLVILPAAHRDSKTFLFIRIGVSLSIGAVLTTLNFGYRWEVGRIVSNTAYKAGSAAELRNAEIGVNFGLRGVNITLHADDASKPEELKHEIVDYNEQFSWTWDQGRFGFGPFAGRLQRQFRDAQRTGLPLPILWIADYLTLDGEGYRYGRFYRTAGWYAHIAMWTAFPSWLLTVILLHTCVRYGAALLSLTGLLQIIACVLWVSIRNPSALVIPFEHAILTTRLGRDFYLVASNGFFCLILGTVIWILDQLFPEQTSIFFGINPLSGSKEQYLQLITEPPAANESSSSDWAPAQQQYVDQPVFKKRKTIIHKVRQRAEGAINKYRRPVPVPRELMEDEDPIYSNQSEMVANLTYSRENESVNFNEA